ncbi:Dynamin-related protein 3a [Thalictrum thalictroides]|uniref:Dynamin-related protein 3a n=1 Tax=Thalictrum thalictroides TaxID=46969 RepID=A0A7J6W378_THATH|nr:Dynamin-related protein 3a [Thalictrum thalictroides]
MASVIKELKTYGEVMKSKAEQGSVLLHILSKYCEAFSSLVDGKIQEMSTTELIGGARIHYIFQSIFVKSLEEVDPCDGLNDEDIRTAIQNATGPKTALFVPEIPFEVLVKKQIARLLDPSLQCLYIVYDELIKDLDVDKTGYLFMQMSCACETTEIQWFPVLKNRLDEVLGKFLRDGVKPAERMIGNIIEMEMDYINTSHPNFIGGSKAVEIAMQQVRSSKDGVVVEKLNTSERGQKSRAVLAKSSVNISPDQAIQPRSSTDRPTSAGNSTGRSWGISSIFKVGESRTPSSASLTKPLTESGSDIEQTSVIQLREVIGVPYSFLLLYAFGVVFLLYGLIGKLIVYVLFKPPSILRPSENQTDQEAVEIILVKLLLNSYYDIVRKNIQDFVPKAIMYFLVNHTKRELLGTFIKKLYRESLFEEMLQEQEEVATQRKRTRDMFHALQLAAQTLEDVESEVVAASKRSAPTFHIDIDAVLSKNSGLSSFSRLSSNIERDSSRASLARNLKSRRLSYSGEQTSPQKTNGGFQHNGNVVGYQHS